MANSSIFHPGPIEKAIGDSINLHRSLACFITDDSEESSRWEDVYLQVPDVVSVVKSSLVLLRLQAGSVEAGFLAAFCPIQAVPYLVIIKNGALAVNIAAGASEEEFIKAIKKTPIPIQQPVTETLEHQNPSAPAEPVPTRVSSSSAASSSAPSSAAAAAAAGPSDRNVVYEERKARLEQKRATEEKEERERRLANRPSTAPESAGRSSNMTYLEQQRKRQFAAQEERQRVLRLLENDKIERRQREAGRRRALEETTNVSSSSEENTPIRPATKETAISFRLLDGSSLKARFPSESILGTDVRAWLDANRGDSDHPYIFLQILAPLPNKSLSISDENASLVELGLSPTATLVLIPTPSYTTAYRGGGTSNEVGLLSKAYSMVYGAVTTVLGVGYSMEPSAPPITPAAAPAAPTPTPPKTSVQSRPSTAGGLPMSRANSANGRIRTLYDQRDEGERGEPERKYYNGNQLDFEPKPKDEKGKGRKE